MRAAAALAAAALLPAALAAEPPRGQPERRPAEGREVPRLVDGVLAAPADAGARARLDRAASGAAAAERRAIAAERAALLEAAARDKAEADAMLEAKAKRTAAWKKDFSKACGLAASAETAPEAVAAYERLLEVFPVYSDNKPLLADSGREIRAIFYETVKRSYPYLAEGRATADSKMIAALQFVRASEKKDEYGGRQNTSAADAALKKAEKFRRLEQRLARQYAGMESAMLHYGRRHWAEAEKYFGEVLAADKGNEEALYYGALAKARAAAAAGKR